MRSYVSLSLHGEHVVLKISQQYPKVLFGDVGFYLMSHHARESRVMNLIYSTWVSNEALESLEVKKQVNGLSLLLHASHRNAEPYFGDSGVE